MKTPPSEKTSVGVCGAASRDRTMCVVVGIGANLGDRLETMSEAARRVGRIATITARSRIYETAPVGGPAQPLFLNAALRAECTMSPLALLAELLRIERELGRVRGVNEVRFGPRLIDLDVLWIDDLVVDDPALTVPHPRLLERTFARVPLIEVAPGASDPRTGRAYSVTVDATVRATSLAWSVAPRTGP